MPGLDDAARGRLLFGGDYNPEQWPRAVWDEDMLLMRAAGVNLATVGVFSWATLEPTPGARDFGWLDEVMDLLHANGIGVALATPTASPPPWMGHRWPQTLPENPDGTVRTYGSRNAYCPSSPVYREFAARISEDLAARYARHPALRMWHIGNEFGTVCHCDRCAAGFRAWLRERYTDLAGLNEAWGTAFWSQRYSEWAEVIPPRQVQYIVNPTQDLDYQRFASDLLLQGFTAERDIVRAHNPAVPVTTNFMGFFKGTDSWKWAEQEDFVSLDSYPDPNDPAAACRAAMEHDLTRSLGAPGGKPWLLMEQSPAGAGWRPVATPKRPGLNRLWSLRAVARGADGILHFQWRASKQGAERAHGAMVPHAGHDSRVFREICALGRELASLGDVLGAPVHAEVAILHDWDAWRAVELDHQPHSGFRYLDRISEYYTPLWRANITADFARPEADLAAYKLVVAPNLYQITDAAAANLDRYVRSGGILVLGPFSGVTDPDERVRLGGYPAPLRGLLGLRIEEYWPLPDDQPLTVRATPLAAELGAGSLGRFTAASWAEWLTAEGADAVAVIEGGPLDGIAAVLRHPRGAGAAWYVATLPEPAALAGILAAACAEAGAAPVLPGLPDGVEAVRRGDWIFRSDRDLCETFRRLPSSQPCGPEPA
jgi:beta-galactosidase